VKDFTPVALVAGVRSRWTQSADSAKTREFISYAKSTPDWPMVGRQRQSPASRREMLKAAAAIDIATCVPRQRPAMLDVSRTFPFMVVDLQPALQRFARAR